MKEPTVRISLINPIRLESYCMAGGIKRHYVSYQFPDKISNAIGLGVTSRYLGVLEGERPPRLVCLRRGEQLIAVAFDYTEGHR